MYEVRYKMSSLPYINNQKLEINRNLLSQGGPNAVQTYSLGCKLNWIAIFKYKSISGGGLPARPSRRPFQIHHLQRYKDFSLHNPPFSLPFPRGLPAIKRIHKYSIYVTELKLHKH